MSARQRAGDVRRWRDRELEVDSAGMRRHIEGLPVHLASAASQAAGLAGSLEGVQAEAVAVLGMGGSAIGGDLVAAYTEDRRGVPLVVVRGYDLPAWLGRNAWVIASSYSGNTEETLAAYGTAKDRGLPAIVVTTGGRLAGLASRAGDPQYALPPGLPPRAALGHLFAACAVLVARLAPGLDHVEEAEAIAAVGERLAAPAREWLAWNEGNPALEIAREAVDALPLVYAAHPVSIAAGRRWRTQLNENAKLLAFTSEFPEQNHNELVAFEVETAVRCGIFYLETAWDHERTQRRMRFVRRTLKDRVAFQRRVAAGGDTPLESMLRLCLLGDCASFLASVITGRDPTPVASIDALKSELSR